MREGYFKLNIESDDVRNTIYNDDEFSAYADRIDMAFDAWMAEIDSGLRNISGDVDVKKYVVSLAAKLIAQFDGIELIDKYDVYEVLLSYWQETMADDIHILKFDGYAAGRETENIIEKTTDKSGNEKEKYKGWEGKLIPKALVECAFFSEERSKLDEAQAVADRTQSEFDELIEEHTGEDGFLAECLNDKDKVDSKKVSARIKELKKSGSDSEEYAILCEYTELTDKVKKYNKIVKELFAALDEKVRAKYAELTDEEIKEFLVNRKWYYTIFDGIKALYVTTSHNMANRVSELAERYESTLPELESEVTGYEAKVKSHLERMGFVW